MQHSAARVVFAVFLFSPPLPASDPIDEIRHGNFARSAPHKTELTLLDWNIDRGTRLDQIAAGMESQKPDLAVLQEVDLNARRSDFKDIAQELAKRLNMNFAFAPEFQELGQSSSDQPAFHGQAILTSLPIRSSRLLRFELQSGFWKPQPFLPKWALFQRRLGGRVALISELEFNNGILVVYNLHLESRSGGRIQYAQLKEVLKDTEKYPRDTPIIIAGDFNTKYPHSIGEVTKLMRDSGYESALGERHARTHVIIGDLDWIFARSPIALSGGKVLKELHGSDHFAVSAQVIAHQVSANRRE